MPAKRIFFPKKSMAKSLFTSDATGTSARMWFMVTAFALFAFILGSNVTPLKEALHIATSELFMASARAKAATSPLNPNSCAPVTKEEIQLAFPVISDHLYNKEKFNTIVAAIWGVIPSQDEDPRIYDMFEAGLDNFVNSTKSDTEAKSEDPASSIVLPLNMVSSDNADAITNKQIPQLNNMKLIDVIKGMVRGNLAPEQNKTIRQFMAQILFFTNEAYTGKFTNLLHKLKEPVTPASQTGAPAAPTNLTLEGATAAKSAVEEKIPDLDKKLEELALTLGTPELAQKLDDMVKQYMAANDIKLSSEDQALYDQFIADLKAVTLPPCTMQTPPAAGKMCFCTDPNQKNCKWKPKAGSSNNAIK